MNSSKEQQQQAYCFVDPHRSPSGDPTATAGGGSDGFGSPASSSGSPDVRSTNPADDSFKVEAGPDKKSVKILQRPSTARSAEGRLHPEAEVPYSGHHGQHHHAQHHQHHGHHAQHQQTIRRGHRKKTLSLDPEEREALESLIEDVIIVGLDDAVVDSDDSPDEEDDGEEGRVEEDCRGPSPSPPDGHSKSFSETRGYPDKFLSGSAREGQRGKAKGGGGGSQSSSSSLNRSYGGNGFSKDLPGRRHGKDPFKAGQSKNPKDGFGGARNGGKEPGFGGNPGGKPPKETPKKSFPECPQEESPDKDGRQSMTGILGVNIYPAQLKVAIKHMDSLPPRFLRRLQTGQNRIGGSEPALLSLSELNLNAGRNDSFPRAPPAGNLDPSPSSSGCGGGSSERDRGGGRSSKHSQLEERKKTIRNLLSDLDQYTDEGIVLAPTSVEEEEEEEGSLGLGSFVPMPPSGAPTMDGMKPPTGPGPLFRMPHARYSSESRLDAPRPEVYYASPHAGYYNAPGEFRPELPRSREFVSLDVASHPAAFQGYKPCPEYPPAFPGQYDRGGFAVPHLLKKTSLKPDAPIFVSSQFQRKPDAVCQKSPPPPVGHGPPRMTSTPNKGLENGGIAFLPGVLNADVAQQQQQQQQAKKQQQQQQLASCKSPVSSFGTPFKMMPGPIFSPVQSVSHQNGMIQQQQQQQQHHQQQQQQHQQQQQQQSASMMRMMNFGPPQVHPYSPYAPPQSHPHHPSVYMGPADYQTAVYQPWSCSPPNGDVPSGDWFPPMMAPYMPHPNAAVEGARAPYEHQGLVPMDMMGQEWKVGLPYGQVDRIEASTTLDVGRQRALHLLAEGRPVFILLACAGGEADRASKLQLNMAGMVVINMSDCGQMCSLPMMKVKEQQDWNYRQVMEAMESRKSLIVVELSFAQQSEVSELVYAAQMNGYEPVVINSYQKYLESQAGMEAPPSSIFVGGSPDFKVGMSVVGFPSPNSMMSQAEGSLDFPSNNA